MSHETDAECSIENCDRLDELYNEYNALYDQITIAYLSGREDGKNESRETIKVLHDSLTQAGGDNPPSWVKQVLNDTKGFK